MTHKTLIAGCGNPHISLYLNGAGRDISTIQIIALAESDPKLMAQANKVLGDAPVKRYDNYITMFNEHPEAEAVIIGSDNLYHYQIFQESIRRHLHIYMMKVISMNETECRNMIEMSRHYDRVIACELELHFRAQFAHARTLIQAGKLGELQSIYLSNVSQSPCNYYSNWGDPVRSYGCKIPIHPGDHVYRGGAITDHPHPYDMIRWLTGRNFRTVKAVSAPNQRLNLQVEDHAAITGQLDGGVRYFINPSYSNLEEPVEERRLIWSKSLECNLKVTGTRGWFATDFFDRACYLCGNRYPSPNRVMVDFVPPIPNHRDDSLIGSFSAALEGRRKYPETGLTESYEAVRVMNAAYDAIYQEQEITLS